MRKVVIGILGVLLLLFSSCGVDKNVDKMVAATDRLRGTVDDAMIALQKTTDTAALAIPGERYQRLIDAVHSGDPKEKELAQKFIKSLFDVDLDNEFSSSIWFKTKDASVIDIHAFQSGFQADLALNEEFSNRMFEKHPVGSNYVKPLSLEEINLNNISKIKDSIKNFDLSLKRNRGTASTGSRAIVTESLFYESESFSYGDHFNASFDLDSKFRRDLTKVAIAINDGLYNYYKKNEVTYSGDAFTINWNALTNEPYLFIVVHGNDWDNFEEADAVVHVRDNVKDTLRNKYKFKFERNQFVRYDIKDPIVNGDFVMYAFHNMEGSKTINGAVIEAIKARDQLLKEFEEALIDLEKEEEEKEKKKDGFFGLFTKKGFMLFWRPEFQVFFLVKLKIFSSTKKLLNEEKFLA